MRALRCNCRSTQVQSTHDVTCTHMQPPADGWKPNDGTHNIASLYADGDTLAIANSWKGYTQSIVSFSTGCGLGGHNSTAAPCDARDAAVMLLLNPATPATEGQSSKPSEPQIMYTNCAAETSANAKEKKDHRSFVCHIIHSCSMHHLNINWLSCWQPHPPQHRHRLARSMHWAS